MGKLGVIIVAAGKGSRMGTAESKQYLQLGQKPILVHTLQLFQNIHEVNEIILVVGGNDVERCAGYVQAYGLSKVTHVLAGGAERQDSVRQGLAALAKDTDWVLVHDGVRPFVKREHVFECLAKAQEQDAAVLAVPVKDTIKVVDTDKRIQSTPDRRSLWAIQTPQAFRLSLLREAHERALQEGFMGTDDAMLVERIGTTVYVVEGDYYNIKITTPEDLPWAEWILQHVRGERQS
ncbi:2-C-methyl-D-erythritol 4-phosphate cytidylyltransferase [Paenibacillus sp. GCM10023248]|uniref:2-C-methyl-D-erythritol 4-phosphate cytidylyltransferase n=1 Tax=Bacillales TaxID=1385 RepID=UPI00237884B5|nr:MULTISPECIES: 2-C-methyl-D-erythritol 4-phosphate cytidylyltransferase [Bacillales]MDD9272140.1 2-C-methyl-D-erythritol 4-phosphate cytidylyltransferase [Paenibacillus sp. MAHUQ-63]MDR6885254.1 2-C-methyl-D-erythritol 4-phosphate cytidylyltransferase [Bacillus sp. 3255]